MARRWILTVVVAAVLVVGAILAAHAIRDDDRSAPERAATATTRSTTTSLATTTTSVAPSTTTPPTTTTTVVPTNGEPPGPCGAGTGAIRAAIDASVANAQANADLASCRLAASDPSWAAAQLSAKPGAQFDALTVILHGGAGSWSVVATGGVNAGCGAAPQQVIVDLGQFCAGTGGGGA
jgi:hypothetical protein